MEYLQICSFAHKVGQEGEDTYQWAGNLCDLKVERTKKALQEATDKYIICSKNLVSVYEKVWIMKENQDDIVKQELITECNMLKLQELVSQCDKVTVENVSTHGILIYKNYTQETIDILVEYHQLFQKRRRWGVWNSNGMPFGVRNPKTKVSYKEETRVSYKEEILCKTIFEKGEIDYARILISCVNSLYTDGTVNMSISRNLVETLGELISAYKKIQEQEEELLHTVLQQRIVRKVFERDFKTSAMMEAKREAKKATEKAKQAAIDARNAMLAADEAVRLAEEAEESEDETLKKKQDETLIAFSGTGRGDDDTDRKSYNEEIKIYNKTIKL